MKREDLKAMGLTDEQIDKIMAENGKDVEKHKADAATAKQEAEAAKAQLAEAGKTIDTFKAMNPDELKKAADDWKAKAEQAQKDAADQIAALKFDTALRATLKDEHKVKDPADVIPHLKRDTLKLDDATGKFIGLNEQIEPLKKSKDYLFAGETQTPAIVTGGTTHSVIGDAVTNAARRAAGLTVQGD